MANTKVLTGAIGIIKVGNTVIGKMKGIRVTENVQRGEVRGIGTIVPSELPALSWRGTLTCDFFAIDLKQSQIPGAINRDVSAATYNTSSSTEKWVDQVTLQEVGVQIDIYKKIPLSTNAQTGIITPDEEPYATIKEAFLDSESFDVTEGQISGRNQSFMYKSPILYV